MISIIIPCRNEEKFISACLDSLLLQDYPKENLEILVIDGDSTDKTAEIIRKYSQKHPSIKLLKNPQKFTPFGLNIGIQNACGKIICRMDAHAVYKKDYISKCVYWLNRSGADNVGGVIKTLPKEDTIMARAIALCLSHPFGAGSSHFRIGSSKSRWVDTVFGGCYRKEVFDKIGLFNEKLIRSQDIEFNRRLRAAGGKILLVPEIVAFYYPQPNFRGFLRHNFSDGIWVTYPLKFGIRIFSLRHLVPLIFILTWWISPIFLLYLLANLYFSGKIAWREKDIRFFFLMPLIFANRHLAYGLGSLWGLIKHKNG
jgi:glycosyltransferase involved in cell wall biosynthesis